MVCNSVGQGELPLPATLEAGALEWIREHPDAFEVFCSMALAGARVAAEMAESGQKGRIGAKNIWEVMRYSLLIQKKETEKYMLNNNHVAYVMRQAIKQHPHLAQWVETREVSRG